MPEQLFDHADLEAVFEQGELPDMEEIRSEILETAGVTSGVFETPDQEPVRVGHILLADYDDDISFPIDNERERAMSRRELIEEEISGREGIHALFRSSPGSYHVWDLGVAPLRARVIDALRLHGDPMHAAVSLRRGMFVLRCSPKVYSEPLDDGESEVYKAAPELLDVWVEDAIRPQSRGHLSLLRSFAHQQGRDDLLEALPTPAETESDGRFEWRGDPDDVQISRYFTVTDELKREVW